MRTFFRTLAVVIGAALVGAWLVYFLQRAGGIELSRDAVREAVIATIEREAPASFLVTGTLDITATADVEASRSVIGLNLGTTTSAVRVPGRVSYGFDIRNLDLDRIAFLNDTILEVGLPELEVHSVEPSLARLEVRTDRGWSRWAPDPDSLQRRALAFAENALRRQATAHLLDSYQPRINTADALEALLRPVLAALGHEEVRLRFRVSPRIIVSPER